MVKIICILIGIGIGIFFGLKRGIKDTNNKWINACSKSRTVDVNDQYYYVITKQDHMDYMEMKKQGIGGLGVGIDVDSSLDRPQGIQKHHEHPEGIFYDKDHDDEYNHDDDHEMRDQAHGLVNEAFEEQEDSDEFIDEDDEIQFVKKQIEKREKEEYIPPKQKVDYDSHDVDTGGDDVQEKPDYEYKKKDYDSDINIGSGIADSGGHED